MKILYATDGFDASIAARQLVLATFRPTNTEVTVVSVTHSWSLDPGHIMLELDSIDDRRRDSEELVRSARAEFDAAGFNTKGLVLEGHPGKELLDQLERDSYDVAVVGSGSHSWAGHRLLGSVSTLILHEAQCSAVIAHEFRKTDDVREVIVGVDGSETATQTVEAISRILDPASLQIEVLSVAATPAPVAVPVLMGPSYPNADTYTQLLAHERAKAARCVADAAGVLHDAGFQVVTRMDEGTPGTVILDEARQDGADLVVVGCRGLGPIRRVLLGSVSDQVARHATAAFVGRFTSG